MLRRSSIAVLALVALPLTGLRAWVEWLNGLRYFEDSFRAFPWIQGLSLTHWLGANVASVATVVAIGFALLGRGRNGLARFGVASVVASPTLSLHGLSPALAGAFVLGPELLWFCLGLAPWRFESIWLAVAIVGLALLIAPRRPLSRGRPVSVTRRYAPARPKQAGLARPSLSDDESARDGALSDARP